MKISTRRISALLTFLVLLAGIASGNPDDRRRPKDPIDDLVAVTVTHDGYAIVVATPALSEFSFNAAFGLPIKASAWRFRLLRLRKSAWAIGVAQAYLSTSGTKMLVVFRNGQSSILDLTKPILQFGPPGTQPTQQTVAPKTAAVNASALNIATHSLIRERYIFKDASGLKVLDDSGLPPNDATWIGGADTDRCRTAFLKATTFGHRRTVLGSTTDEVDMAAVVMSSDGVVCRVTNLGTDVPASISPTATRLEAPSLVDAVLLASNDGKRIRVVLMAQDGLRYRVVDPDAPPNSGDAVYQDRNAAVLRAAAQVGEGPTEHNARSIDSLAAALERSAPEEVRLAGYPSSAQTTWTFYRPQLPASLYAPVIEFAESEDVFPSSFGIWSDIDDEVAGDPRYSAGSKRKREAALFDAYRRRFGAEKHPEIHVAWLSYPGTWLVEYWFYYPFDRGPGHHIHDSEHIFVEVDKLGGFVRQMIGAAHGAVASNNIYRVTTTPDVPAALLPLYAFVEKGKHASAPDIDKDGIFSLGTDVNVFRDRAKVWGVRDDTAVTDINIRTYDSSMTLRRDPVNTHVPRNLAGYFPEICDPMSGFGLVCDVTVTPIDLTWAPHCFDNQPDSEACGFHDIADDEDARRTYKILKPAFAPNYFIRGGYTLSSAADGTDTLSLHGVHVGTAIELSKFLPPVVAFPGRIAIDSQWRLRPRDQPDPGFGWGGLGVHYERLSTNLFGYYLGYDALRDPSGKPSSSDKVWRGWLAVGLMFEYAPYPHLNVNAQFGGAYSNTFGVHPSVVVSLAYVTTNHANFGGRRKDLIP